MRAILQRVTRACVRVDGREVGAIGRGFLILLGVEDVDAEEDAIWLSGKIARMRIFDDGDGAMNLALADVAGSALVVSQFTLHASTRKGNRPSFIRAARPELAIPLYERFLAALASEIGGRVATGIFGARMEVELVNDGPVTIWIDSRARE